MSLDHGDEKQGAAADLGNSSVNLLRSIIAWFCQRTQFNLVARFQAMVRAMAPDRLEAWIERAGKGLLASFARGVVRDLAAVRAALTLPWSNGQTEGQITKLKLVKRQMYGRGKIDLLQARLVGTCS